MAGGLSSKVLQLKFMQRAMDKEKRVQEADAPTKDPQDERWVVEGAKDRCVVLLEGDPPATTGRMSFQGYNAATEALQKEFERRDRLSGGDGDREGASITDEEMALKLAKREERKKKPKEVAEVPEAAAEAAGGFKKPKEFQGDAIKPRKKKLKTRM